MLSRVDPSLDRAVVLFQDVIRYGVLVKNAGITVYGAIEELSLAQVKSIFETNFFGVVRMTESILPAMRCQAAGRIVNIGSVAGFVPMPLQAVYAAPKHALAGWNGDFGPRSAPFWNACDPCPAGFFSHRHRSQFDHRIVA